MAWWTRALPLVLLVACNDPQVELSFESGIGASDLTRFSCADGFTVDAGSAQQAADIRTCLGLGCGGRFEAGSADCASTVNNPAATTCVGNFYACISASGACTSDGPGSWQYANGARGVLIVDTQDVAIYPPSADEACILRIKSGYGVPEAHTYVRPL